METFLFPHLKITVRTDGFVNNNGAGWSKGSSRKNNFYCVVRSTATNRTYYVHRLVAIAFIPNPNILHFTQIDHISRDRTNNSVSNLRWISGQLNGLNRTSVNAFFNKRYGSWNAKVRHNGKVKSLGYYKTKEEASAVSQAFKQIAFRVQYLSRVKNDTKRWVETSTRAYLHADKAEFALAAELIDIRARRHRALRKQVRQLFLDFPETEAVLPKKYEG